jgi:hypothetical protein
MAKEKFYPRHSNSNNFLLKSDGVIYPLDDFTSATFSIRNHKVVSSNGDTDPIRWCKPGYASGEIRIFLSGETITAGIDEEAYLVIYSPSYPAGYVWGSVDSEVIVEVEATG